MTTDTKKTIAAKPKRTRKVKTPTKTTAAAAPAKSPESQINPHTAAGLDTRKVARLTNAMRPVKVLTDVVRVADKLSSDKKLALYALRACYAGKAFPAFGLDGGIVRDLAAAGLIKLHGGVSSMIDGKAYLTDGETPVTIKITAAGASYGKA